MVDVAASPAGPSALLIGPTALPIGLAPAYLGLVLVSVARGSLGVLASLADEDDPLDH